MRRTLMSIAGGTAMLLLIGCGANAPSDSGAESRAAISADEKPADEKPADEKPADEKPAGQKPAVVRGEAALGIPYAAKSLSEFAANPYIVGVVRGTVTKVESRANDVGSVNSIVTVTVERGLGLEAGSTIRASEHGGVVPMSEVRDQFEGKEWQEPLTAKDLSRTVDYQLEGFPHSDVGDDLVMFLSAGAGDGVYSLAAKLVPNGAGFSFKDNEPPNPRWNPNVPAATVEALIRESAE